MPNKAKRAGAYNKAMLKEYNKHVYHAWLLSDSAKLTLPAVPDSLFVNISSKEDSYIKTQVDGERPGKSAEHYVSFIQKNDKPHCFTWTTTAEKLRQGVRWGIIPTESITGKVIGTLGQYRVVAHERVVKGLISNRHRTKIALLDHYQDRFEALQVLESLVNKNNIDTLYDDFKQTFEEYEKKLQKILQKLDAKNLSPDVVEKLKADINEDIANARHYFHKVNLADLNQDKEALRPFNRARGNDSILEFVKRQMTYGLYEMQGINQDITYSKKKRFALTRGAINDCIEDARKAIGDHRADPRNLVLPEHHGHFGVGNEKCQYNFKHDHLTPEREREVLLGISFIEEWDKVVYDNDAPELHAVRYGMPQARPLAEVAATYWTSSVNFTVFIKKVAWIFANALLSIIGRTQTLDENAWQEKGKYKFRAYAVDLRRSSYVRTYEEEDPWYIKAIKLIFPRRGRYFEKSPWYTKVVDTILGDNYYREYDSFSVKFKKTLGRIKAVLFSEAVKYHGARPNDSLWWKLGGSIATFLRAGKDVAFGFKDFFVHMFFNLWRIDIYYDYQAGKGRQSSVEDLKRVIDDQINDIKKDFALYMDGYELCFMLPEGQPLERNKFYLAEKLSPDRKHAWLEYKVIGLDGREVGGRLTSSDLDGWIWDFPNDNKVQSLRHAFKNIFPTMLEVTHQREHTQDCSGVNKLIGERHANDESPFQTYSEDKASHYNPLAKHAHIPYRLVPGDQNDIITAMVRGVDGFASFFTHNFAKDPVGAVAFGTAYAFVGGSIMLPKLFSFLGTGFQGWAQGLGLSVASGGPSSAVAGACIVGQWGWGVVDVIEHGPQSGMVKSISMVLENPLTLAAGVGAAWLAGHVLTISIPVLRHDLGTNEDVGKLTFGGKGAVALYEALHKAQQNPGKPIKFTVGDAELELNAKPMTPEQKKQNDQFRFVQWLAERQAMLPRLSEGVKHKLARHIDYVFEDEPEKATSLKEMIFPKRAYSIAHQLVSIPLGYIPAVIRLGASFFTSPITGSFKPMQIAWSALGKKFLKDWSRLLVAAEGVVHIAGNVISAPFKLIAYLLNMAVGRVAGWFGESTGHAAHKLFAPFDIALRKFGEILFPASALKHMAEEHYCSALERQHTSQAMLLKALGVKAKPTVIPVDKTVIPEEVHDNSDEEDYTLMDEISAEATSSARGPNSFRSTQQ